MAWRPFRSGCQILAVFVLGVVTVGCQNKEDDPSDGVLLDYNDVLVERPGGGEPLKPIPVNMAETMSITGTARFSGGIPSIDHSAFAMGMTKDPQICTCEAAQQRGDTKDYAWVINQANKGVKNVVVFIMPVNPSKEFFQLDLQALKEKKLFPELETIEQPFCAFDPHVVVAFNKYVDVAKKEAGKDFPTSRRGFGPLYADSTQKLEIKNNASISHNADYSIDNPLLSPGASTLINKKLTPSYEGPVTLKCSIHPWMRAYIWAFPHPWAAVTDKDGKYEIKGVPAGLKFRIVAWHETAGWLIDGSPNGKVFDPEQEKTLDLEVKAP